jgi:hypothetical protein
LKGDDVAKLKFHGLDLIFRSIGSRFGFPVANFVRVNLSLIFKLAVFRLSHAHVHGGACLNNEKVVTCAQVVNKRALFLLGHLFTQIASHEQPWRPHGQPA